MNAVKQERHDEAEIRELAAKFVEAHKAKMANANRPPLPQGQSMNILSFLTSDKNKAKVPNVPNNASTDTKAVDEESAKGRFGWTQMGKSHIPYIYRSEESYCSVRMVEMKVLNKLINYLHQDLYNCTNIRSYYITDTEAKLLNEINFKHCDYLFGREQFTSRDLIVRLADAFEFYMFLVYCYNKLLNGVESANLPRCGFIRINRESVVPYTVYNEQKYVPLFYFEGETDNLKQRADKLEGWDLSYLKFCCKVQGIRNELFAHDACSVISLSDIKNYFPPGTLFEDYWPKKNMDSQLLLNATSRSQSSIVQWTRQPTAPPIAPSHPPPSPKPATQAKAANNSQIHNVHVYNNFNLPSGAGSGGQPPYHSPQPRTASSAVHANYAASSRHMRPPTPYYTIRAQAPPPLVRATQSQASYPTSQNNTAGAGNYMMMDPSLNQNNYHQASQLNKYPPPLLHMNGGLPTQRYDREIQNSYGVNSNQGQIINQQPAHQATRPQSTTPTSASEDRGSVTNGRMQSGLNNIRNKLITIPEPPLHSNHIPYKIVAKEIADGKMVQCIPMKPYQNSNGELLVTLPDLIANFFHNVPVQSCQQVMQILGIELYKPNSPQLRLLMEIGKCQNINEVVPLVQVKSVIDYMPQLKYMLSIPEIPAKRQRTS